MKAGKIIAIAVLSSTALVCHAQTSMMPIPTSFESTGPDRKAIEVLLDTYTKSVSTKDQALFESLLLDKDIPFSDVDSAVRRDRGIRRYEAFRKSVFDGPPFTQKFQDVHIMQDGSLANVSLVFVNTSVQGLSWGWKTLQLLKVAGQWKIASEFYTGHW